MNSSISTTGTIGVLALQGDVEAHLKALERAGARAVEVRSAAALAGCDGLVIPGGESTTMLKLLEAEGLMRPLLDFGGRKPILGTCAGAILLASKVTGPGQASLGLIDIDVERNAYGRQIDSRIASIDTPEGSMEAVFIRAPIIRRVGKDVAVRASYNGDPVWVEQGMHMAITFHPELSRHGDGLVHRRLMELIAAGLSRETSGQISG